MGQEIEEQKSRLLKNKEFKISFFVFIMILGAQFFDLLGLSWIGAGIFSIFFFYAFSIKGELNNFLGIYSLERELDEREKRVIALEEKLMSKEKIIQQQLQNINTKFLNYLFRHQRELWDEIKSEHLFDNYHEGRHFIESLKFHFDKNEIKLYGQVDLIDQLELKKDIVSVFGNDIPIIMINYIEKE